MCKSMHIRAPPKQPGSFGSIKHAQKGVAMVLPDVRVRLVDLDSLMDAAAAVSTVSEAELGWESSDPLAEMEAVRVGDGGQRGQYTMPHDAGTKKRSARDC